MVANKVFLVMAGGEQKKILFTPDVERFLHSLVMNTALDAKPNSWADFTDTTKAFSISFPKTPSVSKLNGAGTDPHFESTSYSSSDQTNSTYYVVGVSDTRRGFIITEDSLIFNSKLNYYKENQATITDTRKFDFEGNNAFSFSAGFRKDGLDLLAKVLLVCRGNRSYYLAAVTQKGKEDYPDITHFFRSFILTPYPQRLWSNQQSPGKLFSTWAPGSFAANEPDTMGLTRDELQSNLSAAAKLSQLIAHEPYSTTTYTVLGYPVSKYYAATSDSSFLQDLAAQYFSDTSSSFAKENTGRFDSLVYKKQVINGQVNGIEVMMKNNSKRYFKRTRIFTHGDSTYHLIVTAPYAVLTNRDTDKFFNDFRFSNENVPSSVVGNKTAVILSDLASTDSATKMQARTALENSKFEPADLPLLYQAYLKQYPADTTEYTSTHKLINNAVSVIRDSSIISFVKDNYLSATLASPELKPELLYMLANQQSYAAVSVLKDLLLTTVPTEGTFNAFINKLSDSSLLGAMIFPEAARFFGDSLLGPGLLCLASELIDSNLLQKNILLDNTAGLLHTANSQLQQLKNDVEFIPSYNYYVIDVLKKLNNAEAIHLLNGFAKTPYLQVKRNALLALLELKQTISPTEVRKLAADEKYRTTFYEALKEMGMEKLFSAEFLTQQHFAKSYLYNNLLDDETSDIVCKLIGERIETVKGVQQRFYLFNVSYIYKDSEASNLAICGRFSMDRKKVRLSDDELKIKVFYDKKFTPESVNKLYGQFIDEEKKKQSDSIDIKK